MIIFPHGFKPKKSLGQYFLVSNKIADKLIDALDLQPTDNVLEIGAGTGILTARLGMKAQKVYAVEIDKRLIPILQKTTEEFTNIEIIHQDILKLDWLNLGRVKIIGNIPYFISSSILLKLLESVKIWDLAILTVQIEFTHKLLAPPGKSGYCPTTVLFDYYTERKKLFSIPASWFRPSPKIVSAAIIIKKRIPPIFMSVDFNAFSTVVMASFKQPRKTIANNLSEFLNIDKDDIIKKTDLDLNRRAETFSTIEFCRLTKDVWK